MSLLRISSLLCLLLVLKQSNGQGPWTYECVDDILDFKVNRWESLPVNPAHYAESSSDLPGVLQGNLEGNGIFYFKGDTEQVFFKQPNYITINPPVFLYVRYYGQLVSDPGKIMYVMPTPLNPDGEPQYKLPSTSNFQWGEQLVELDPAMLPVFGYYIGANSLDPIDEDYFLVDKIIVAHGDTVTMDEIKALCPSKFPTTTTTTTTTTTESTTIESAFVCREVGYFADPFDCTKYHYCQYNEAGDLFDHVLYCTDTQVWCPDTCQCESSMECACFSFV